jgi:hypothetical protein
MLVRNHMRFTTHSIGLAVLLALVLGHESIAVHAAAHEPGEMTECDLCIAYGDASETLDTYQEHGVPPVVDTNVLLVGMVWHTPRSVTIVHQRGPPAVL